MMMEIINVFPVKKGGLKMIWDMEVLIMLDLSLFKIF